MYAIKFMTALSLVSLSLAAPVQYGSGSLQHRSDLDLQSRAFTGIEICELPARGDVQAGCLANPVRFTLTKNALTAAPAGAQPANTECDHSLELQVLKQALNGNGACTALNKILDAGGIKTSANKEALLKPLFDAVNAQRNVVFLDKAVNAEKRLVVQHALGDGVKRPASTALTAVKAYLANASIKPATTALATSLDGLATTMINNAVTQANAALDAKAAKAATARQKAAIATGKADVTAGKALFKPATGVSTAWTKVLTYAAGCP